MRQRLDHRVDRARRRRGRAAARVRAAAPAWAVGALTALAAAVLAVGGCAARDANGGVRVDPGAETTYPLSRRHAADACRDAAVRGVALGVETTTARLARCSLVGARLVCAEEEISCLGVER